MNTLNMVEDLYAMLEDYQMRGQDYDAVLLHPAIKRLLDEEIRAQIHHYSYRFTATPEKADFKGSIRTYTFRGVPLTFFSSPEVGLDQHFFFKMHPPRLVPGMHRYNE